MSSDATCTGMPGICTGMQDNDSMGWDETTLYISCHSQLSNTNDWRSQRHKASNVTGIQTPESAAQHFTKGDHSTFSWLPSASVARTTCSESTHSAQHPGTSILLQTSDPEIPREVSGYQDNPVPLDWSSLDEAGLPCGLTQALLEDADISQSNHGNSSSLLLPPVCQSSSDNILDADWRNELLSLPGDSVLDNWGLSDWSPRSRQPHHQKSHSVVDGQQTHNGCSTCDRQDTDKKCLIPQVLERAESQELGLANGTYSEDVNVFLRDTENDSESKGEDWIVCNHANQGVLHNKARQTCQRTFQTLLVGTADSDNEESKALGNTSCTGDRSVPASRGVYPGLTSACSSLSIDPTLPGDTTEMGSVELFDGSISELVYDSVSPGQTVTDITTTCPLPYSTGPRINLMSQFVCDQFEVSSNTSFVMDYQPTRLVVRRKSVHFPGLADLEQTSPARSDWSPGFLLYRTPRKSCLRKPPAQVAGGSVTLAQHCRNSDLEPPDISQSPDVSQSPDLFLDSSTCSIPADTSDQHGQCEVFRLAQSTSTPAGCYGSGIYSNHRTSPLSGSETSSAAGDSASIDLFSDSCHSCIPDTCDRADISDETEYIRGGAVVSGYDCSSVCSAVAALSLVSDSDQSLLSQDLFDDT